MTPGELREYLDVLRESGAARGELQLPDNVRVRVEFGPATQRAGGTDVPASPFVDKEGAPIDLDEGNPWVDRIAAANAKPVKPGA